MTGCINVNQGYTVYIFLFLWLQHYSINLYSDNIIYIQTIQIPSMSISHEMSMLSYHKIFFILNYFQAWQYNTKSSIVRYLLLTNNIERNKIVLCLVGFVIHSTSKCSSIFYVNWSDLQSGGWCVCIELCPLLLELLNRCNFNQIIYFRC